MNKLLREKIFTIYAHIVVKYRRGWNAVPYKRHFMRDRPLVFQRGK